MFFHKPTSLQEEKHLLIYWCSTLLVVLTVAI